MQNNTSVHLSKFSANQKPINLNCQTNQKKTKNNKKKKKIKELEKLT